MIHIAGPLNPNRLQRCTRCGYILTDYRNTMVPEGSRPLSGWQEGAAIKVLLGNPTYSGVTDAPPDCFPTGNPLTPEQEETLAEMRAQNDKVDEAVGTSRYDRELILLALLAREFLRRIPR